MPSQPSQAKQYQGALWERGHSCPRQISQPSQAKQYRKAASVLCLLMLGIISLAYSGCAATASRDMTLNLDTLAGKSHAWFTEHWGAPHARSKRFFGGETWVYFHIDGNRRSIPLFTLALHECQMHLTFNHEGILKDAARAGC